MHTNQPQRLEELHHKLSDLTEELTELIHQPNGWDRIAAELLVIADMVETWGCIAELASGSEQLFARRQRAFLIAAMMRGSGSA